jgi:hypothetical protein
VKKELNPMTSRFCVAAAILCLGCSPNAAQPWRKALDEGKVIRLGGSVGRLEPPPRNEPTEPAPQIPTAVPPPNIKSPEPKKSAALDDQLPVPPPPKSLEGKPRLVIPAQDDPPSKKLDS